jgi:hypothetical protein
LHAYVGDPAWLAVGRGCSLEAATTHKQQIEGACMVQRLPPAESERCLALLNAAGRKVAYAASRRKTVRVLQIVKFDVGLCAVTELMTHDETAVPALREISVAEV